MSSRSSRKTSSEPPPPDAVEVGLVVRPHGVRGEVVVEPWSDAPGRFAPGSGLTARPSSLPAAAERGRFDLAGRPRSLTVSAVRPHSGRLLVAFDEVADRDAADELRGTVLEVPRDAVPEPEDENTFYFFQLVGCRVHDAREGDLGEVVDVAEDGGGHLLVIEGEDGRRTPVPFARAMVRSVDVGGRRIEVELPEGLVEACASRS